jgi:3-hydroxyisobutyrate dehydrogenase-like beta-hydroxyacid dehydrogenase
MKPKIGFIGMGTMGVPMSHNIAKADYEVTVFNRSGEKYKNVDKNLVAIAPSLKALVENCDVIITMLTGPQAIEDTFDSLGKELLLLTDKIVIDMSTISPSYSLFLKDRLNNIGAKYLDAPVSGSVVQAESAQLVIMASGYEDTFDEINPILKTMGKKVVYCGEVPKASTMKLAVNLLLGIMMEGFAESYNFAMKGGLKAEDYFEVILDGGLAAPLFKGKADKLKNGDYKHQFALKHITKDLKFAVDHAYDTGASVFATALNLQLHRKAMGMGHADDDMTAIMEVLKDS